MLFRPSGSGLFGTSTNITLLRIFPLQNSWKMLRKLKWQILAARYNWCQGPVPGRGPAVEKHWHNTLVFKLNDLMPFSCTKGIFRCPFPTHLWRQITVSLLRVARIWLRPPDPSPTHQQPPPPTPTTHTHTHTHCLLLQSDFRVWMRKNA
jgi:hypothetical protein